MELYLYLLPLCDFIAQTGATLNNFTSYVLFLLTPLRQYFPDGCPSLMVFKIIYIYIYIYIVVSCCESPQCVILFMILLLFHLGPNILDTWLSHTIVPFYPQVGFQLIALKYLLVSMTIWSENNVFVFILCLFYR